MVKYWFAAIALVVFAAVAALFVAPGTAHAQPLYTAQQCSHYSGDPKYVGTLGPLPATPISAQGSWACVRYGIGSHQFLSSASCLATTNAAGAYAVVTVNGVKYCLNRHHASYLVGSAIHDIGDPTPPDDVEYPVPVLWQARGELPATDPSHCTNDNDFVQVIGQWRGRTVCEIKRAPIHAADCPTATPPKHGRLKTYPADFKMPQAGAVATPGGTQFCIFGYSNAHYGNPHRFWFQSGWRAIRVIEPATPPRPQCVNPPGGLALWYANDGNDAVLASGLAAQRSGVVSDIAGPHDMGVSIGTSGRIGFADDPAINVGAGNFTLDAWIRTRDRRQVIPIADKRTGSGSTPTGYFMFLYGGRLSLQTGDGRFRNIHSNGPVLNDGNWHFVAVTVNRRSRTAELWVDGQKVQTSNWLPAPGASLDNTAPLLLGHGHIGEQGAIDIDEVELFNRVLPDREIVRLSQGPKCKRGRPATPRPRQ